MITSTHTGVHGCPGQKCSYDDPITGLSSHCYSRKNSCPVHMGTTVWISSLMSRISYQLTCTIRGSSLFKAIDSIKQKLCLNDLDNCFRKRLLSFLGHIRQNHNLCLFLSPFFRCLFLVAQMIVWTTKTLFPLLLILPNMESHLCWMDVELTIMADPLTNNPPPTSTPSNSKWEVIVVLKCHLLIQILSSTPRKSVFRAPFLRSRY